MDTLTFRQLRYADVERLSDYDCCDWTASDWATSLAGEVGELCNFIKKERRGDGNFHKEIEKELADVVTYCDLLANYYGIDLGRAVRDKFNEVSERIGSDTYL